MGQLERGGGVERDSEAFVKILLADLTYAQISDDLRKFVSREANDFRLGTEDTNLAIRALYRALKDDNIGPEEKDKVFKGLIGSAKSAEESSIEIFGVLGLVQDELMVHFLKRQPDLVPDVMRLVREANSTVAQQLANQILEAKDVSLMLKAWPEMPRNFSESAIYSLRHELGLTPRKRKTDGSFDIRMMVNNAYSKLTKTTSTEAPNTKSSQFTEAKEILEAVLSIPREMFEKQAGGKPLGEQLRPFMLLDSFETRNEKIGSEERENLNRELRAAVFICLERGPAKQAVAMINDYEARDKGALVYNKAWQKEHEVVANALRAKENELKRALIMASSLNCYDHPAPSTLGSKAWQAGLHIMVPRSDGTNMYITVRNSNDERTHPHSTVRSDTSEHFIGFPSNNGGFDFFFAPKEIIFDGTNLSSFKVIDYSRRDALEALLTRHP